MSKNVHVLNGDALAERFPALIEGERIIFRECLVDGPVSANSFDEFLQLRSNYLGNTYPDYAPDSYESYVASELTKLAPVTDSDIVYLWFERDVFCQVNAWFVCHQLLGKSKNVRIKWVLPTASLQWGYADMDTEELQSAFEQAQLIDADELALLSGLWQAFASRDSDSLKKLSTALSGLDFISPAVEAVIGEIESNASKNLLREIITQTDEPSFGKVFRQFHAKGAIFGYGDLQVKRLYDEIMET